MKPVLATLLVLFFCLPLFSIYAQDDDLPARLVFAPDRDRPYIITAGGELLQPEGESWHAMVVGAPVRDIYIDNQSRIWAATGQGIRGYSDGQWRLLRDFVAARLVVTHGYLFALGAGEIRRGPEHWRVLEAPDADHPATELVMLGDHSHALLNGGAIYRTNDLGLSWGALDAPESVTGITIDSQGILLAVTDTGVLAWRDRAWTPILPLPGDQAITALVNFRKQLYALAGGTLYRQNGTSWVDVAPAASLNVIAVQYSQTLWVMDAEDDRLWFSADGDHWTSIPFRRTDE
jgi:hypothetical protein